MNDVAQTGKHQQPMQLKRVLNKQRTFICAMSYTMYSLQRRVHARAVGSPGPMGITTPSYISTALAGFGAVLPTPLVELLPGGRFPAQQSAWCFSLMSPSATSQRRRMPVLFSLEVKQQFADFEDMSAKQTPLPNMQPVTGASGGAMRRPWLRIPTKLVSLLPCHSSILLSMCFVQRIYSASLFRENRSTSYSLQEVWVEPWVDRRYLSMSSNYELLLGTGSMLLFSFLQLESSSFQASLPASMREVATLISASASSISIFSFTTFSLSRMKLLILLKPKSCGMLVQNQLVKCSMFLLSFLPLSSSISFCSMPQPFWMCCLVSCPSGIFLTLQPICVICCFIMSMSKISYISFLVGAGSLLSQNCFLLLLSPLFPVLSSYFLSSLSSPQKFSQIYWQFPLLHFYRYLLLYSRIAASMEKGPVMLFCPRTPTRPQRVQTQQELGFASGWTIWMMQNLLLLLVTDVWLRVALQALPPCCRTRWVACLRVQCSSIGTFPLNWIVFIYYFASSLLTFKFSFPLFFNLESSAYFAAYFAVSSGFFLGRSIQSSFFYRLASFLADYCFGLETAFDLPVFLGLVFSSVTLTAYYFFFFLGG